MIKVLYVQEPAGGGSLIALYEMIRQLDRREVEPVVLCYYRNNYTMMLETIQGCKVIYASDEVNLNKRRYLSSKFTLINIVLLQYNSLVRYFFHDKKLVRFIYEIIKTEQPDLVHHFTDIISNRQAVRAAAKVNVPQIIFNHSLASYGKNFVDYILDYFLVKKIAFHIHMTHAVLEHFTKLFHLKKRNSIVLHDFVDTEKFKPAAANELIKKEFDINEDGYILTNIGRITEWKGQHIMIEAVNLIKDKVPAFKVLIVGPYDKGVGSKDYYDHLQNLSEKYQLKEKIIFTGNREDIAEIINTSNIIVHTAVKPEPQGIVILEALLCKKLVVATNAGGAAELIKKYGGVLVKPSDAEALAAVLLKLMKNENDFSDAYPFNYPALQKDFSTGKQASIIMDIYNKVKKQ